MTRIIVTGGLHCGKTTLVSKITGGGGEIVFGGQELVLPHVPSTFVFRTDSLRHLPWPEQSVTTYEKMRSLPSPWIIEGVTAMRGLRHWYRRDRGESPCDVLFLCFRPYVELSEKQLWGYRQQLTIWREIESRVRADNHVKLYEEYER